MLLEDCRNPCSGFRFVVYLWYTVLQIARPQMLLAPITAIQNQSYRQFSLYLIRHYLGRIPKPLNSLHLILYNPACTQAVDLDLYSIVLPRCYFLKLRTGASRTSPGHQHMRGLRNEQSSPPPTPTSLNMKQSHCGILSWENFTLWRGGL